MADYFSSDIHFDHRNIIKYCDRPFDDVNFMNEEIIRLHNETVTNEDTWRFVGDFAFCNIEKQKKILARMNGKKKIIYAGNHDRKKKQLLDVGWDEVYEKWVDWEYEGIKFRICHYPFKEHDHTLKIRYLDRRPPREGCDWLLTGHVHTAWFIMNNQINVGVDNLKFKPISIEEIAKITRIIDGKEECDDEELLKRIFGNDEKTMD